MRYCHQWIGRSFLPWRQRLVDNLVPKYQPNSWKWRCEIDLFYATVDVIVYVMHRCQKYMDRELETSDPICSVITSNLVADTVTAWVHCSCHFSPLWSPEKIPFGCFGCPPVVEPHNSGAGLANVGSSTNEVDNAVSAPSLSAPDMDSCLALNTFLVRKSFISAWVLLLPAFLQAVCLLGTLTTLILCHSSMD